MKSRMYGGICALILLSYTAPVHAATIVVDAADGKVVSNQECSINEALLMANDDAPNSDCNIDGTFGNDDTIQLTKDVTISASDDQVPFTGNNGKNATVSITSVVTIDGRGFKLSRNSEDTCTLDGENTTGQEFRLLHVGANGNLTIKEIALENGCADGNNNQAPGSADGGAIYNQGNLVVENSTLTSNRCWNEGGGIFNASGATLDIRRSVFAANASSGNGGGLSNNGAATIAESTFSENAVNSTSLTGGRGGAVFHYNGTIASITGSTFSGNSAANNLGTAEAGALHIKSDVTEIANNTFSDNTTAGNGAAISMGVKVGEGQSTTVTTVKNNTFSANTANVDGVIANLEATVVNFYNNLFYGDDETHCLPSNWGSVNASNNLDDGSCPGTPVGTVTNFDTALKDNGGPTKTHALLPDSNAIDAGKSNEGVCTERDQRGFYRRDDDCDIGAFEFGATRNPPPNKTVVAPINSLLLQNKETSPPPIIENCCFTGGLCSPLSTRNCQQAGGTPISVPCEPNPCNF